MATKHNFMLKVIDSKMGEVRKALKEAGVNVVSIVEVHKEDIPGKEEEQPAAESAE